MDISALLNSIRDTHLLFAGQVARQIDTSLTLRNWLIGMYLVEYEQKGQDRAQYGNALYQTIASRAKSFGLRGMGKSNLYGFRTFYLSYPQIFQFLTGKFQPSENQLILRITEHASEQIQIVQSATGKSSGIVPNDIHQLLNRLTYTHFVELMRCEVTSAAAVASRRTEGRFLAAEGVISRMEGKISHVFMRHLPASPKLGC